MRIVEDKNKEEANTYRAEKDPDLKALERFKKPCWWQKNREK
jgi:hypothetical protein